MELIIGIIIIALVGYFLFFGKKKDETVYAPAKTELPVADEVTSVVIKEAAPVVESAPEAPAKKPRKPRAPKAEKPAVKKAAPKKVAAIKTTKKSKNA
jgi:hypothetical protein